MAVNFGLRDEEVRGVYRAIFERRDIRSYKPDAVPLDVLTRVLAAAHHAPSVGFMQPWNFLVVENREVRVRVHDHFRTVNQQAAQVFEGDKRDTYRALKLQGILDAPLNVLVTCDPTRGGEHVLGRFTIPETDAYSTCLAVQNLWLAARAEGLGVGWMSLYEPAALREIFGVPDHVQCVAYLTLGYPIEFPETPMLERIGWARRTSLDEVVYRDRWGSRADLIPMIRAFDEDAPKRIALVTTTGHALPSAELRNADLTKPAGSLGRLEEVALLIASIQRAPYPRCDSPTLLLFAGDHGVTAEGVSAYRPETTARMVYQFVAGGAVVNALARLNDVDVVVVDVGVDHEFGDATGLVHAKVRRGTHNFVDKPAMSADEAQRAIDVGRSVVDQCSAADVIALGEMGIGNSTCAAAIVAALLGIPAEAAAGRGTGISSATLERKVSVIERALARHPSRDATQVLANLGGFEIAAMVGAIERAAEIGKLVLLDGFITGAAALIATQRTPSASASLLAAHHSAERAHGLVLGALGLTPLLDLGMRLGEGSGAVLAVGLIRAAVAVQREVRTFEEANIERTLDARDSE